MKIRTRILATLVIYILTISGFAYAQGEAEHAFVWTRSSGMDDIGTLPGMQDSFAYGLSLNGEVVGYNVSPDISPAFRWADGAGMQLLPGLGAISAIAYGVNASGQIVGAYYTPSTVPHAFLWSPATGVENLGTLGGTGSVALAINRSGQVVGYAATPNGESHAFLWTQNNGMQDLGTLNGGASSIASAINDQGQIVGSSTNAAGISLAVLWKNGSIRLLGVLGSAGKHHTFSNASGINNAGHVVGTSSVASSQVAHFFMWTAAAGMQDLGEGTATGVNRFGQVVGYNLVSNHNHAFVWTSAGGLVDIGTLGGTDSYAYAINDDGEVAGMSLVQ